MTVSVRQVVGGALLALLTAAPAPAQQAPNRKDVVERVDKACPGLIRDSHAFTDAVWSVLHAEDARWGRNGKRGNQNDLSDDAGAYLNPSSPLVGSDGRRLNVIDMIGCAGGGPGCSPSPAWIDQTQATINAGTTGVWVAPSGRLPACLAGGPVVDPPPVTQPPPTGGVDLGSVHEQLAAIRNELTSLRESRITKTDMEGQTGILYRLIAEQLIAVHVGELVERIDKLQADVAAIRTRVERARILGY